MQRGHDGFELGAATMNVMIMLATLVVAGGVSVVITYPDVAVKPLMLVLGAVAIVLPVVLYPFSYTLWFAVELLMDPPSDEWLARAAETISEIPVPNA